MFTPHNARTHSNLFLSLRLKYRLQRLNRLIEASKETLWTLVQFLLVTSAVAYFGAHYFLFITGYYVK